MAKRDIKPLIDIPAAIGLLTRLPVKVDMDAATARGAASAWAYPLAGLVVGVICTACATLALTLGLAPAIAAVLSLATATIITGAMHEDGLADTADGFWGGWDPARRLDIMKDSHIGAYGVIALILSYLIRWSALTVIISGGTFWPAIIAIAMTSRASMVNLMAALPNARATGLSQSVGRPQATTAHIATAIATLTCLLLMGGTGIAVVIAIAFTTLACALIAQAKINGQTGDTLGAAQQLSEIAALLTLAAMT